MPHRFEARLYDVKGKLVWWIVQLEIDSSDVCNYICSCIDELTAIETAGELNARYIEDKSEKSARESSSSIEDLS